MYEISIAQKSDSAAYCKYMNIVGGQSNFLSFSEGEYHNSIEEVESVIEGISKSENQVFFLAKKEKKIIGAVMLEGSSKDRVKHNVEMSITVAKDYWGHGIGKSLISRAMEWAKSSQTIKRITINVIETNKAAIHLYRKFGFIDEGILRDAFFVNNEFHNIIQMGYFINE